MEEEFHIGHRFKEYINSHGIKLQWLCGQMHCHRNTLYNLFERNWIDSDVLMKLSLLQKHDFFEEFSEEYKQKLELKRAKTKLHKNFST
jgi:hypothetical protein